MKKPVFVLFSIIFLLTACGQSASATQTTPLPVTSNSATPFLIPTATQTSLPTQTPTASITPLPTIPTFTPTINELVQPNPFPTGTPNPAVEAVSQKWNSKNVFLSPNGQWAAVVESEILHIVQVHGNQELTIKCEIFIRCEFVIPLQWSPNSQKLYVAPILTGEFLFTFSLNTGIGRMDVKTGKFEKLVEDGTNEGDYNASLSPDGNYIAITDMSEEPPKLRILETTNLQEIAEQEIIITLDHRDYGVVIGNMIWTPAMKAIVFVAQSTSSISSILYYDREAKTITTIVEKDPTFVELLFINDNNQVALSKTTYYPLTKSYWHLDLSKKEMILISTVTPQP